MTTPTPGVGPLDTFAPGLFAGRTALVTGGGSGIGRRTVLGFARFGADVVLAGREADRLDRVAAEAVAVGAAAGHSVRATPVVANIRDVGSVTALRTRVVEEHGAPDFLVNNAGGQFPAPPAAITDNGWRSVVDLNLNGTWNVLSRFMRPMADSGFGAIVNVVHIYALDRGAPYFAHSGAARAGVVNLTRTLAPYLAPHGVTVNALAPGTVGTSGFAEHEARPLGLEGARGAAAVERSVARRLGTAEEVAAMVLFLCSPAARFVTGAVVVQDGGESYGDWPTFWEGDDLV